MPLVIENLPETIRTTKKELKAALPKYREIFQDQEAGKDRRPNPQTRSPQVNEKRQPGWGM